MTDDKTTAEIADLHAMSDLCTPWCIHVVATLRIADHIASGNTSIATLAQQAGCDSDFLQRVLRYLVGKGVFQEPAPGQFTLKEHRFSLPFSCPLLLCHISSPCSFRCVYVHLPCYFSRSDFYEIHSPL